MSGVARQEIMVLLGDTKRGHGIPHADIQDRSQNAEGKNIMGFQKQRPLSYLEVFPDAFAMHDFWGTPISTPLSYLLYVQI